MTAVIPKSELIAEAAYRDGLGREGESAPSGSADAPPLPSALRFFGDLKRLAGPAHRAG